MNRFLDAIDEVGNVEGLAVKLSTSDQIEHFSPPIFASYCSKNAKMCIERLARYKKLIGPMHFEISETKNRYTVAFLPGEEALSLSGFVVESEIAFLINIIRKATKEEIKPIRITVTMEPKDSALADFAGIVPTLGEENAVSFDRKDTEIPFITFDDRMWEYFEPELNLCIAGWISAEEKQCD